MHIYFSGIGGTGIGPLALMAKQAGYSVSGSDKQDSTYIEYLKRRGLTSVFVGDQTYDQIKRLHQVKPIDWLVYSTAIKSENSDHPELQFCKDNNIHMSARGELLNTILTDNNLEMVAVAGTHGKSTTTAMAIWLFQQLGIPISYSVGAKMSFADMGHFESGSSYFVYEADEYARNFLEFTPKLSLITGIDWDHPDIYPTRQDYISAFQDFAKQSNRVIAWQQDVHKSGLKLRPYDLQLNKTDSLLMASTLVGSVNRQDAVLIAYGLADLCSRQPQELIQILNNFPGISRRFERLAPNIFTDYAHTPPKIRGTLETAREIVSNNVLAIGNTTNPKNNSINAEDVRKPSVIVVYEGLHNMRQHFIKNELKNLFDEVSKLYIVPSYLAREDPNLPLLSPDDLINLLSETSKQKAVSSQLDDNLWQAIQKHQESGDLVLCISAGGGGSLDEWVRKKLMLLSK